MSSSNYHYLGGYFSVPEGIDWHDLTNELKIVDKFIHIEELNICISNYLNAIKNDEYQIVQLKDETRQNCVMAFELKHASHLAVLSEHFGKPIDIEVGAISYYW